MNARAQDMFAAGVLLFSMRSGLPPYGDEGADPRQKGSYYKALINNSPKYWNIYEKNEKSNQTLFSSELKSLIIDLVRFNPSKRLTAD